MLEPSQNNEKKPFDLEKPLDEIEQPQAQPEKEVEFEKEKTEDNQINVERTEPVTTPLNTITSSSTPIVQIQEDKISKDIEMILSEDMEEIYKNLPKTMQEDFKKKGEQTALEIRNIINQTKIIVSKILNLIRDWLLMVPKVNKFFLEQECKIKTEKVLKLAERTKNKDVK